MTQDDYREKYASINKGWTDSVTLYKSTFSKLINSETVIMEAGCGFSNLYKDEYKKAKHVIGVDISEEYLALNDVIQEKIVSDLSNCPQVKNNSVDLIVSAWVLEHLESPEEVFAEFSRILKPGGKLVFLTPNNLNYIVFLNKLIPHWFRLRVARKLGGELTVEPMPTFYRANSVVRLSELARSNGLTLKEVHLNGDPTYVAINKLFFYAGILVELVLQLPLLRRMRVHIIGVVEKPLRG